MQFKYYEILRELAYHGARGEGEKKLIAEGYRGWEGSRIWWQWANALFGQKEEFEKGR